MGSKRVGSRQAVTQSSSDEMSVSVTLHMIIGGVSAAQQRQRAGARRGSHHSHTISSHQHKLYQVHMDDHRMIASLTRSARFRSRSLPTSHTPPRCPDQLQSVQQHRCSQKSSFIGSNKSDTSLTILLVSSNLLTRPTHPHTHRHTHRHSCMPISPSINRCSNSLSICRSINPSLSLMTRTRKPTCSNSFNVVAIVSEISTSNTLWRHEVATKAHTAHTPAINQQHS